MNCFKVLPKPTIQKTDTFRDLLASNDLNLILNFIETKDIINGEKGFEFNEMMYLLKDINFYK